MSAQLHTYVEARLGRWRLWYHWGKRPGPRQVRSWYWKIIERNVEQNDRQDTNCPVPVDEAELTDRAVQALPPYLRSTIFEAYLRGGTVDQKCRALGLRSRQSYYDRLPRCYAMLLGYFNDQAAGVDLPAVQPYVAVRLKKTLDLTGQFSYISRYAGVKYPH